MYHSIDDSSSVVSTSPATFRRHVAWLASGVVAVLIRGLRSLLFLRIVLAAFFVATLALTGYSIAVYKPPTGTPTSLICT